MTQRKVRSSRDETAGVAPRSKMASHTRPSRRHPGIDGSTAPSTLPPPPFESEASVGGLEWWLDAHMALASGLLCLEQILVTAPEGTHADTVRRLSVQTEAARDALYELYCDAADARTAPLLGRGTALEQHVRDCYAWCVSVVGVLVTVTNGLRGGSGPNWRAVKAEFRKASEHLPFARGNLAEEAHALAIDFTSPTEPLRNLPHHLEQLVAATRDLQSMLVKRFG